MGRIFGYFGQIKILVVLILVVTNVTLSLVDHNLAIRVKLAKLLK